MLTPKTNQHGIDPENKTDRIEQPIEHPIINPKTEEKSLPVNESNIEKETESENEPEVPITLKNPEGKAIPVKLNDT